jgi:hypothetical protein
MFKKLNRLGDLGLLLAFPLCAIWLWGARAIFTKEGIFPISDASFENLISSSASFRPVFDIAHIHLISGFVALLPLVLILVSYVSLNFLLSPFVLRQPMALLLASALFFIARPGESYLDLGIATYSLLCLLVIYPTNVSFLRLWLLINTLGFFSLYWLELRPLFIWTLISLILRESFVFIFAYRLRPEHRDFKNPLKSLGLRLMSTLLVVVWLISIKPDFEAHQFSSFWWLSFVAPILCVLLAFKNPWESKRWIGLASFSLGLLLFSNLSFGVFFVTIALFFEWANSLFETFFIKIRLWMASLLLSLSFLGMGFLALHFNTVRSFDLGWVKVFNHLPKELNENIAIIGDAIGFLSLFYRGSIIQNPSQVLEGSEKEMAKWMNEEKIGQWVVDRSFLTKYWKDLIQSGIAPERINVSILSRLSLHDGQAIQTNTINLPPIELFEGFAISSSSFMVIREKKRP